MSLANIVEDKLLTDIFNEKFRGEYVYYHGIEYYRWKTNWYADILYNRKYPWTWMKWSLIYHDNLKDLVEYKKIHPIIIIRPEFKDIVNGLEINPSRLITKPQSIISLERKLNTIAKLHSLMFGKWHISCRTPEHKFDISIVSKYEEGELYEVMYDGKIMKNMSLSDINKLLDPLIIKN